MRKTVSILGVEIDSITRSNAVQQLVAFAKSSEQHHVMTPNPEMLVEASRNLEFYEVLNRSHLNLPDGVGLLFAAGLMGKKILERISGADVTLDLAAANAGSLFFLGAAPGVAERAAAALKEKFPSVIIAGTYAGSPKESDAAEIINRVNQSGASILLVAYGAPAQDFWISRHLRSMPSVRLAMGVGGTFDFLSGTKKRAPLFMRKLGLEWLFRFFLEPKRFKRIFTATVLFPLLVVRHRSLSPLRANFRT